MSQTESSGPWTYEMFDAWKKARALVRSIYHLTRCSRVRHDYGLTNQIRRAGVSVMSNIAEGYERSHLREKLQFYNVARGSTAEVRSLLYVIEDNYPELQPEIEAARTELGAAVPLLAGLIRSTRRRRCMHLLALTLPIAIGLFL
jgi:four helix bundle protein